MADVSAIFGLLLALGIAFPGLLAAWWLLFPATIERARIRLDQTPWRCFWLGGVITAMWSIPTGVLLALPAGPAKFLGLTAVFLLLTLASLGAAGLAAELGQRLRGQVHSYTPLAAFARGAVALELAAFFPLIGWLVVMPLTIVTALGASAFALLHWLPPLARPAPSVAPEA